MDVCDEWMSVMSRYLYRVYICDEWISVMGGTPLMGGPVLWVDMCDGWTPVMGGHLCWVDTCDGWDL